MDVYFKTCFILKEFNRGMIKKNFDDWILQGVGWFK